MRQPTIPPLAATGTINSTLATLVMPIHLCQANTHRHYSGLPALLLYRDLSGATSFFRSRWPLSAIDVATWRISSTVLYRRSHMPWFVLREIVCIFLFYSVAANCVGAHMFTVAYFVLVLYIVLLYVIAPYSVSARMCTCVSCVTLLIFLSAGFFALLPRNCVRIGSIEPIERKTCRPGQQLTDVVSSSPHTGTRWSVCTRMCSSSAPQ